MSGVILFRRSRLNHNSFASIVGALARAGLPEGYRIILQNHTRTLPKNTRIIAFSFSTPELDEVISEVQSIKKRAAGAPASFPRRSGPCSLRMWWATPG